MRLVLFDGSVPYQLPVHRCLSRDFHNLHQMIFEPDDAFTG